MVSDPLEQFVSWPVWVLGPNFSPLQTYLTIEPSLQTQFPPHPTPGLFCFFLKFYFMWDKVSLSCPGWPGTTRTSLYCFLDWWIIRERLYPFHSGLGAQGQKSEGNLLERLFPFTTSVPEMELGTVPYLLNYSASPPWYFCYPYKVIKRQLLKCILWLMAT